MKSCYRFRAFPLLFLYRFRAFPLLFLLGLLVIPVLDTAAQVPPAPWASADIGAVGEHKGAVVYNDSDGSFRLNGSGGDIWEKADAFFYVYQILKGDGTVVAHFREGLQFVDPNAEAGVMIRSGVEPGAAHALLAVTSLNGIVFKYRTAREDATARDNVSGDFSSAAKGKGAWLKLERTGTHIAASLSTDGTTWTSVGDQNMDLGPNALIGSVMTPHDNNQVYGVATFDNVKVSGPIPVSPVPVPGGAKPVPAKKTPVTPGR